MRIFWLDCLLYVILACLLQSQLSKGFTVKIKLKGGFVLKISLKGTKEKNITESTDIDVPYTDEEQWSKVRGSYSGSTAEENIDNNTSLFDRIVIVNAFSRSNTKDDNYLFQGDILMNLDRFQSPTQKRKKRAIIAFDYFRWDVDQGIPYKLHRSLNDASRRAILSAMREWEESLPCLKWRVKTDRDVDFVHFFKGDGCYSKVGRAGGEQSLSIGRGCEVHGIVLHEMGHALGIFHEQSRPDRDNYVDIIKENILEGFYTQFEKFGEDVINSYNIDYDYSSIMHYSATAFARERGLVTIEPRPKRDVKFGQRDHLSKSDILQARAMYACNETEFIATPVPTTAQTTQAPTTTQLPTTTHLPSTEQITTPTTMPSTTQPTQQPTTQTTTIPTTAQTTQAPTTTQFPTTTHLPSTEQITTPTTMPSTTQSTEQPTTQTTTTTEATTTAEISTPTPEATTDPTTVDRQTYATTAEPEHTTPMKKSKVCADLVSTCYKWIRKGYCSPLSPNYSYMKYFCSRTCEMWRNSELSRGVVCVDLIPECKTRAAKGQCRDWNEREYMENMCCESCRVDNCLDESPHCAVWANSGACTTFFYVQKHCKRSCNLCDI